MRVGLTVLVVLWVAASAGATPVRFSFKCESANCGTEPATFVFEFEDFPLDGTIVPNTFQGVFYALQRSHGTTAAMVASGFPGGTPNWESIQGAYFDTLAQHLVIVQSPGITLQTTISSTFDLLPDNYTWSIGISSAHPERWTGRALLCAADPVEACATFVTPTATTPTPLPEDGSALWLPLIGVLVWRHGRLRRLRGLRPWTTSPCNVCG